MSAIFHEVIQGTDEWLNLRLGKITGTRLKDVFKSNNLTLIDELISERLTGQGEEMYVNAAMERGTEMEPIARSEYSEHTGQEVHEIGFVTNDELPNLGLSPDGYVGADGAVEFKCPSSKKHIEYIRMDQVPNDYKYQILMYFIINIDIQWVDFVSFDPRVQIKPLFIKRTKRRDVAEQIDLALSELAKFEAKLTKYYDQITF